MPQLELKVDNEHGQILKSDRPLNVSLFFVSETLSLDCLCAFGRPSRWWTQRRHGSLRYDQEAALGLETLWILERTTRDLH